MREAIDPTMPVPTERVCNTIVACNADASVLLASEEFDRAWLELHASCSWATPFQSPAFVRTWYRVYEDEYSPILVYAIDASGDLVGLLTLALCRTSGEVVHAGAEQAEYQTWLATPAWSEKFVVQAMTELRRGRLGSMLRFLFLAPGTPLAWARKPNGPIRTRLRWRSRGLMAVGQDSRATESLKKKSNKSRLARLKRAGPVELAVIRTPEDLASVIDEIAIQCDLRQGAAHGVLPFRSDSHKAAFYLALQSSNGLLHSSILRVGGEVAAAHVGVRNEDSVVLGLICHAPHYGAHSPGKILLLLLAEQLRNEGLTWLDLTPIGGYKDRFATVHDNVAILEVYLSSSSWLRHSARYLLTSGVKKAITHGTGRDAQSVIGATSRVLSRLRRPRHSAISVYGRVRRWFSFSGEFRLYELSLVSLEGERLTGRIRVNRLQDLLLYKPDSLYASTLSEFLTSAEQRIESGHLVFTAVSNDMLVHYAWLVPSSCQVGTDFGHELVMSDPHCVLYDDYTHPSSRGQGLHQESLRARLAHAATMTDAAPVAVIGVRSENGPSRHNIEKAGFAYCGSAWMTVRRGVVRRWHSVTNVVRESAGTTNDG